MPVVTFHLVEGASTPEQEENLLRRATQLYCDVLSAPPERVRAFISTYAPARVAVAGELVSRSGQAAPFFEFFVLAGRPAEQREALLEGFTRLLVEELGVARMQVRGLCRQLNPEDWAIGGTPASVKRAGEIRARMEHSDEEPGKTA
ncbi:MAG: 4-oxalocrotonate tautomerase family protein [Xanthobacter sp.]